MNGQTNTAASTTITAIIPFSFGSLKIRTLLDENDQPLFVAADVAEALGYKDKTNAIKQHCKGVVKHHPLQTNGGTQEVRVIYEPDLYRLVVGSRLPSAEKFEKWIFDEVLPAIRKTGGYNKSEEESTLRTGLLDEVTAISYDGRKMVPIVTLLAKMGLSHTSYRFHLTTVNKKSLAVESIMCRLPGERFKRRRLCFPIEKLDLFLEINNFPGIPLVAKDNRVLATTTQTAPVTRYGGCTSGNATLDAIAAILNECPPEHLPTMFLLAGYIQTGRPFMMRLDTN